MRRTFFACALIALSLTSCGGGDANPSSGDDSAAAGEAESDAAATTPRPRRPDATGTIDKMIVPETRFGPVTSATSEADLVALVGDDAVQERDVWIGDGRCAAGVVMLAGTPDSAEVVWADEARSRPAFARVRGAGYGWRTPVGIHVGMSLDQLVQANGGRPITFMGLGWDYGGTGTWSEPVGGRPATIHFRLAPDSAGLERASKDPRFPETQGDREVTSDHPLISQMGLAVAELRIEWDTPESTHRCRR